MGVRYFLLIIAVVASVGCASVSPEQKAIVEKAIRKSLKKPEGKLTKADVRKVTVLGLKVTKINDAGLKEGAKLQQLNKLDLSICRITDAGLKEVAKLKRLETLWLGDTKVTKAGVVALKKSLSRCEIWSNAKN